MWCWVLIDSPQAVEMIGEYWSQYTVWCWVLIDSDISHQKAYTQVSIHRVVLGAYRRHLYKPHHNAAYSTVVATGDSRTPTRQ